MTQPGAHVRGYNAHSLGICYEGGLDAHGHPADTRTDFQKHSLRVLVMLLLRDYPGSRLCGHRDLSPDLNGNGEIEPEEWIKECPCFDAAAIVREAAPPNPGCAGRGEMFFQSFQFLSRFAPYFCGMRRGCINEASYGKEKNSVLNL